MTGLAGFTNAFLLLFALDGGLSLIEELFRASTGSSALLGLRNAVALPVVVAGWAGVPSLLVTPRLPARLLMPLFLCAVWFSLGAAPLPILFSAPTLGFVATGFQCTLAAFAFLYVRRYNAARGEASWWWLGDPSVPVFSAGHTLGVLTFGLIVLVPAFLLYSVLLFATTIQVTTREFVSFDREGILLADRRYEDGAREVRLVGMMHIGEQAHYRSIVESFQTEGTVVLEEGVTDETGRLVDGLDYDGVAGVLGLESQQDLASYLHDDADGALPEWPVWRHADVDLATFSQETIDWLAFTQSIWSAEDWVDALQTILREASEDPELMKAIERDIITNRNERLLEHIHEALAEFERVVVPWGALHLPFIEAEILEQGFAQVDETRRRLVSWQTVREALADRDLESGDAAEAD